MGEEAEFSREDWLAGGSITCIVCKPEESSYYAALDQGPVVKAMFERLCSRPPPPQEGCGAARPE